jgi:hypothetical protein
MRALAVLAVAVVVGVALGGCLPPVARPMRTEPGPHGLFGASMALGGEDERSCYEGCERRDVVTVPVPFLEARYGHLFAEDLGVTAGVTTAGRAAAKTDGYGAWALGFVQGAAQTPWAAFALGADVGVNVLAPIVGVDLSPWGPTGRAPAVSIYARYALPLHGPADPDDEIADEIASWSGGATVRYAWLRAGAMYWKNQRGRVAVPASIEGAYQARSWFVLYLAAGL